LPRIRRQQIRFEWRPLNEAVGYTFPISPTMMFTKMMKEVNVSGTAEISGLEPEDYFWNVPATKANKDLPTLHRAARAGRTHHRVDRVEPARRNGNQEDFHRRAEVKLVNWASKVGEQRVVILRGLANPATIE
jgi:hypothetical protein